VARRANAAARKKPLDLAECGVESFSVQPRCIGPATCLMTWAKAFHEHLAVRMEVAMRTGDDWVVNSRFVLGLYIVLAILLIAGFVTLYPNI
jgi:hypothetical protein